MPIDRDDPVQLTAHNSDTTAPSVSPDGKLVAYSDRDKPAASPGRIVIVSFDGGNPIKTFNLPPGARLDTPVRWTPDGRAIAYVESHNDVSNVWSQPLSGGAPRRITDFETDLIFVFDWSRDGKQMALWRGTVSRNVASDQRFQMSANPSQKAGFILGSALMRA